MTPLYGFLEGDTLGTLVLADSNDTAAELCAKLQAAATVRVAPFADAEVLYKGQPMLGRMTVGDLHMAPLERIDVRRRVA
ncbi:MAG TPA: toluene-4-monooxygenase system B family protein [Polyangia bacterium]